MSGSNQGPINGDSEQAQRVDGEALTAFDRAKSAMAAGDMDQALAHANAALAVQADFLPALELAGVVACQQGDLETGIGHFSALAEAAPDNAGVWFNLGNAQMNAGQFSPAIDSFGRAQQLAPENPSVSVALAMSHRHLGEHDKAQALLETALERAPDHPAGLNTLAAIYAETHQFDRATEVFLSAIERQPRSGELRHNFGQLNLQAGRYAEAADQFRAALTASARDPDARAGLAAALCGLGEFDEAIHHFRRALRTQPDHALALYGLIDVLEHENQLDSARQLINGALDERPGDPNLLFLNARLKSRAGDRDNALADLAQAQANGVPEELDIRIYAEIGYLEDELGRADKAMQALSRSNYLASKRWQRLSSGPNAFNARVDAVSQAVEGGIAQRMSADGIHEKSPVFVVGFPRSGTTLLGQMLGAHSSLVTFDERAALGSLAQTLSEKDSGYPKAIAGLEPSEVREFADRYYRQFAMANDESRRLVDKMPLNLIHGLLIKRLFGSAPIVFAVRDPRDAVFSCYMQPFDANAAMANFHSLGNTARTYDRVMKVWEAQREALGLNVHTVRYEDLVADTGGELEKLCRFIGEDFQAGMIDDRGLEGGSIRTPSYRQVSEPLASSAVGRWRRYAEPMAQALPVLETWVERFGYA